MSLISITHIYHTNIHYFNKHYFCFSGLKNADLPAENVFGDNGNDEKKPGGEG